MPKLAASLQEWGGATTFRRLPGEWSRKMWDEPYLESCCRAALHRLVLAGAPGRPEGVPDAPCLHRLAGMGLVVQRADQRFATTPGGVARHATEVLRRRAS